MKVIFQRFLDEVNQILISDIKEKSQLEKIISITNAHLLVNGLTEDASSLRLYLPDVDGNKKPYGVASSFFTDRRYLSWKTELVKNFPELGEQLAALEQNAKKYNPYTFYEHDKVLLPFFQKIIKTKNAQVQENAKIFEAEADSSDEESTSLFLNN